MDVYWESLSNYAGATKDHPYLPEVDEPVWILGSKHSSVKDRDQIAEDIKSLLWFTYRKGFPPIKGPKGPTSDAGWGCMHRCGQMMLAQALIQIHLGRSWRWNNDRLDPPYLRILKMFEDHAKVPFSIHSISTMGVCDDQHITSWLGPNTVAHAIKKLVDLDKWTNLVVHVTAEDGVVIQEIKKLCHPTSRTGQSNSECKIDPTMPQEATEMGFFDCAKETKRRGRPVVVSEPVSKELDSDSVEVVFPPVVSQNQDTEDEIGDEEDEEVDVEGCPIIRPRTTIVPAKPIPPPPPVQMDKPQSVSSSSPASTPSSQSAWRPLLLIVPLRLGLHEINVCYLPALKGLFRLPQCVGIVGGKPNHALWLIGYVEDTALCLDPHTTQMASRLGQPRPGSGALSSSLDGSYHCTTPVRLPLNRLDPSLAVGFVCSTEAQFDELCAALRTDVLSNRFSPSIFEIHEIRPPNLPPPFSSTPDGDSGLRVPEEWSDLYANPSSNFNTKTAEDDFELI